MSVPLSQGVRRIPGMMIASACPAGLCSPSSGRASPLGRSSGSGLLTSGQPPPASGEIMGLHPYILSAPQM